MADTRPSCASGGPKEDYNLPLHVGALFIILGVSAGACALPIIALRVPRLRIPAGALFVFRHFGTGVLIATAFVHLFPTAFISLTNACLPPFFNEQYPAFAGAIALAAVFIISIVEMIFSPGRSLCSGGADATVEESQTPADRNRPSVNDEIVPESAQVLTIPQFGRTRSGKGDRNRKSMIDSTRNRSHVDGVEITGSRPHCEIESKTADHRWSLSQDSIGVKEAEAERKKLILQCMLLECGILFHSVFIGMSLAVAVGHDQIVLLIAIAFHQTFEGLALGSRIAAVGWKSKALQPWFMALAYGCTTPLGQAIGIATRNLYDPDSTTGLVVVGTMNAISSGLLTYTSLVDLLSEDFLSDHSWKTLRGNRRVVAMSLVFFGAFCMSLIGAWA
ncbi:related to Fe2+/Zn2+ regulated transporter [Ramularia collo-cygni]|uniref:Related to Fe2+/Zn2+ regulated transporter n=1 Tax=Ramularia collo-cygni TaxID=112498 RepID=A0A2D3V3Q9_9PEZI|nr:related to Fe2+/Zn2+ regulated transporter [Ramularia collo-cygni]CZT22438.1 related to Fe2+/Zn2+ regulated transporter [Ramularia collo-cygni]